MEKKQTKKKLCLVCKKEIDLKKMDTALLPFCSKRCKLVDLRHWLVERVDEPE